MYSPLPFSSFTQDPYTRACTYTNGCVCLVHRHTFTIFYTNYPTHKRLVVLKYSNVEKEGENQEHQVMRKKSLSICFLSVEIFICYRHLDYMKCCFEFPEN